MIAYFLLVHRFPEQFKRMFKAIHAPGNRYLVHIDKSSGKALAADIAEFLKSYPEAEILPSRRALWGGFSLVDAELRGMQHLLDGSTEWQHYINLSGQDFPLKSQGYIRDFLAAHPGTQFIRYADQLLVRPDTMNRVQSVFLELFGKIWRTGIRRKLPAGMTPYIGTQWKVVSRAFCEHVCSDPSVARIKRFYRRSLIADEGFFQTALMNTFPRGPVVNDDMRLIDWVPDGLIKLRPRTFVSRDASELTLSNDLFARKFDCQEDSAIFDVLERHLTTRRASTYVAAPARARPAPRPHPQARGLAVPV
ncbi:beta-1,6-N-acetylglucosaminyltransferase [Novosphingobium sp. B 225]|uniref:beta-1,6-N-acetylglucosaminyltransferase n=1 Tax=Novosphingobium sp. B 225 TaxID=1961849 RepID=UPI000B4AF61E|nr:beta-1,6-N-acetylglucosaminyltransferase [Novosphingobium sp. B 225]